MTSLEQAESFSRKVVARERGGVATVSEYEFDDEAACGLSRLTFDGPSDAWLDYVFANRRGAYDGPSYDLVVGPVANDNVYRTLLIFETGEISREETVRRLKTFRLVDQWVFCSSVALSHLSFESSHEVG